MADDRAVRAHCSSFLLSIISQTAHCWWDGEVTSRGNPVLQLWRRASNLGQDGGDPVGRLGKGRRAAACSASTNPNS